ncbi:MAG: S8 family serine peptidase [Pseudomonadota bacterium]
MHNNSWGSGCCDPFFGIFCLCDEPLAYDGDAPLADEVTWEFPELLLAIAAGNDGSCCGEDSIGNPAIAKNALTVGASQRGASANNLASFSSQGPTRDRRIKPDVVAQGAGIVSAGSTGNPDNPSCEECVLSGTSMATPTAAGLAGLVRDYLAQGFYPSGMPNEAHAFDNPHAALIRAMVINSGVSMDGTGAGTSPPNQQQGWGRVTLDNVLYFDGDTRELWLTENRTGLVTDDVNEYTFSVAADEPLKLTLVWHDFPGAPNSDPNIVNLLRMEVETPGGQVFSQKLPSSGVPNPFWDASSNDYDDRNTVHQYAVDVPAAGDYIVRVRALNVAMGSAQPYALVVTGSGVNELVDGNVFADGFELEPTG